MREGRSVAAAQSPVQLRTELCGGGRCVSCRDRFRVGNLKSGRQQPADHTGREPCGEFLVLEVPHRSPVCFLVVPPVTLRYSDGDRHPGAPW